MQAFLASVTRPQDDIQGHMAQQKKGHSKNYFILAGVRRYSHTDKYPSNNAAKMGGIHKHGN